jgi:TolB-like protein
MAQYLPEAPQPAVAQWRSLMPEGSDNEQTAGSPAVAPGVAHGGTDAAQAFISYASADGVTASAVCAALELAGLQCWIAPRDVTPGEFYSGAIVQAIDAATVVVLVLSKNSAESQHVLREVERASSKRHPVVSFRIDRAPLPAALEYFLNTSQWLDASATGIEHSLPKLVDAVKRCVAHASVATAGHSAVAPRPPARTESSGSVPAQTRRRLRVILAALAVIAAVIVAYVVADHDQLPTAATPAISDNSIAVLPFVNMSSDPEQEYFSDGISEQVLNLLAKIPKLRVIARTSSFAFKGKQDVDVATIAQRLDVAHVLEGSVRKSGNRVRITAQLINAANSSREWSETYDRELTDIFATQDEIALAVVRQLELALLGDDLPARSSKTSLEAYTLYLQGQHLTDQGTEESQAKAVEFFTKALEVDPRYGEAWAALAYVQATMAQQGFKDVSTGFSEARASAQEALDLNSHLARAHLALGTIQYLHDWDWPAADASFKKAIALDPNDSLALGNAGTLAQTLGKRAAGIILSRKAVALDPIAVLPRLGLTLSYYFGGQLDEAESEMRTVLKLSPEFAGGRNLLGTILLLEGQPSQALETILTEPVEFWRLAGLSLAYFAVGRKEASDAALKEFIEKYADISAYQIAEAFAFRGDKDKAFFWLDRAFRQRDAGLTSFNSDPLFEKVSDDPRYAEMLRKLNLPAQPLG